MRERPGGDETRIGPERVAVHRDSSLFWSSAHDRPFSRASPGGEPAVVRQPADREPRSRHLPSPGPQGHGAFSCRQRPDPGPRQGPHHRRQDPTCGHDRGARRLGRRGRLGLEGRLRGGRDRPVAVPAQVRPGDGRSSRLTRTPARDAGPAGRTAADPQPALGRVPSHAAVLDPAGAGRDRSPGRRLLCPRSGARAFGRHRPTGHLGRTRRRPAGPQRVGRDPGRGAGAVVPGRAALPRQCRADRRFSTRRATADCGADEPAVLGLAQNRRPLPPDRRQTPGFRPGPSGCGRPTGRHHRREPGARPIKLARVVRPLAGQRPGGVQRRDSRNRLRQARHQLRDPADRDRQGPGRGSAPVSGEPRRRGVGRRSVRPGRTPGRPPAPSRSCRLRRCWPG